MTFYISWSWDQLKRKFIYLFIYSYNYDFLEMESQPNLVFCVSVISKQSLPSTALCSADI